MEVKDAPVQECFFVLVPVSTSSCSKAVSSKTTATTLQFCCASFLKEISKAYWHRGDVDSVVVKQWTLNSRFLKTRLHGENAQQ